MVVSLVEGLRDWYPASEVEAVVSILASVRDVQLTQDASFQSYNLREYTKITGGLRRRRYVSIAKIWQFRPKPRNHNDVEPRCLMAACHLKAGRSVQRPWPGRFRRRIPSHLRLSSCGYSLYYFLFFFFLTSLTAVPSEKKQ